MKSWWLLSLVLLAGCPGPSDRLSHAGLTVQVKSLSRTVVADPTGQVALYRIIVSQGGTEAARHDLSSSSSYRFAGLPSGTYTVSVAAYSSATDVGANTLVGAGSSGEFAFDATEGSLVTVPLSMSQTGGDASLEFSFRVPAAVDSHWVSYELRTLAGAVVRSGTVAPTTSGAWVTGVVNEVQVPSGPYLLFLTFYQGSDAAGAVLGRYAEAVSLWDNLVSRWWIDPSGELVTERTFQESDFGSSNALLADLFVGPDGGTSLVAFDSGQDTYTVDTTAPSLVATATGSVDGQRLRWSTDGGTTFADLEGQVTLPWTTTTSSLDLRFEVTAPDRATQKTYGVTLNRLYTLTYDANGATGGTPAPVEAPNGTKVVVAGNTGSLTKGTSVFGGWNTAPDGTGVSYSAGADWTALTDTTLYAQWGTVSATYQWAYGVLNFAAPSVPLVVGTGVTFSGTLAGAQSYEWYLDGISVGTGSTYTFTPTSAQTGGHVVSLVVTQTSGVRYSASTRVVVKGGLTVTTVGFLGFTAGGLAALADGTVYLSDSSGHTIKKYSSGVLTTLAGSGLVGNADGPGSTASFDQPYGVAVDAQGRVFVADFASGRIRMVSPSGNVTTVFNNAGGILDHPSGLAVTSDGSTIYVADRLHNRIVRLVWDGTNQAVATVLAGNGSPGAVDGSAAVAGFMSPDSVALDAAETTLYVGDNGSGRVRKITLSGAVAVSTLASIGNYVYGVAVDRSQTVYACTLDANNKITQISPAGVATDLAGKAYAGSADGPTSSATLNEPIQLAWVAGTLYFVERGSKNLRKID